MAKKNYDELAEQIVKLVGGKENINGLRHCITRVRFRLKDESIAKDEEIKNLNGVVSLVKSGGEYMVVIGNEVENVYDAICKYLGIADGQVESNDQDDTNKGNIVMRILNTVVATIYPALNMICAGGVMKGLLTICTMTGILASDSGLYMVLNGVGDAIFFFLPIVLGYNLAKKLNGDPFLGLVIGAILCYPTLNGVDLSLFGQTINSTYTSTFLPVIIVTAIAMPISKFLNKYIPAAVKGFLTPLITLSIVMPLAFAFIGPATTMLGNGVNAGINALLGVAPVLAGALIAGLYQVMVLFGIHGALTSFSFMNVLSGVPDAVMAIVMFPSFAQIGVVLAMYLKTKDEKLKEIALPAFISGIFGVTEPAIYGVTLPHIKMFVVSCIGAATAGIIVMLTNTLMYSFTGMGVVAILGMANPENPNFIPAILAAVVPFVVSFIMAFVLYKDEVEKEKVETLEYPQVVESPVPGKVVSITEVPDETFSSGMLGKGIAVLPSDGKVYAPYDGKCEVLAPTLHALGLLSNTGISMLVHVGLETVGLEGKPFKAHIQQGESFKKGQLLLEFDMKQIEEANCPTITSILIVNEAEIGKVTIDNDKIIVDKGE